MENDVQSVSIPQTALDTVDDDMNRKQELLAILRSHLSFKYHDALTETISVIQNLFLQEKENMDFSKPLADNIIVNVTSFLDTFIDIFNYISPPLRTQGHNFSFSDVEEKPIKKFRETFRKQMRGVTFLANDMRNKTQISAVSESLKCLDKMCSLGEVNDDDKVKLVMSLRKRMDMEGHWIEMINSYRKLKVTEAIKSELYDNFQEALRIEYPRLFQNDFIKKDISMEGALSERTYYDENELLSFVTNLSSTTISDFKDQIAFEDDCHVITKLVQGMSERLRQDKDKVTSKNLANKNHHKEFELEAWFTQSLESYENKMAPVFNSSPGTQVTIISIEKQHDNVKAEQFQKFHEKFTSSDQKIDNTLQQRIFEHFRKLVSTANMNAGIDMESCRKMCQGEISSCLINLESHLGQVSSESPKYVGLLRNKVEKWMEETFREVTRGTVANKENVEALLKRVGPFESNFLSAPMTQDEVVAKKLERIKSMIIEASKKFIEMTEASKHKKNSSETRASFIRGQVKSQLEFEIKSTFGDCEPTEPHIKDLEDHMNQYIMSKMVKAMENLDKKLDNLPITSSPSSSIVKTARLDIEEIEIKPKIEVKYEEISSDEENDEQEDIKSKMENLEEGEYLSRLEENHFQTASNTELDLGKYSPVPLIFQFSVNMIQIGVMNPANSTPYMLKNDFGDRYTPTIVGLTRNGRFVYGPKLDQNTSNNLVLQTFPIEQHFIDGMNFPWSTNVNINGKSQKVTVELLLGFVLRRLKATAEQALHCQCYQAVIAVPYWMSSAQRVQMKDAGTIAGFLEVHLVNDLPAVAFALITNLRADMSVCQNNDIIMALSENADYVDCAVYAVEQAYPTIRLKMLGHFGCSLVASRMKGNIIFTSNGVMDMCNEALSQAKSFQDQNEFAPMPTAVLVVCAEGANYVFWRQVLERVRMEYTGNSHCTILNENDAVITGAVLLAQNLTKYGKNVVNKVGCNLWRTVTDINSRKTGLDILDAALLNIDGMILPAFGKQPKTVTSNLPKRVTTTTLCESGVAMYQCSDHGRLSKIPVGYLNVFDVYPRPSTGIHKQFIPHFDINHEGIISLNHILIITRQRSADNKKFSKKRRGQKRKRSMEVVSPTGMNEDGNTSVRYERLMENDLRMSWTTPNLTKIQIEQFQKLLMEMEEM